MDIIWLSANKFGYELLKETLKIKDANVKAIITLSRKSNTVMYDGIESKKWHDFGIEVIETYDLNKIKEKIKKTSPDLIIMCGWRQIIGKEILSIPKKGFIGFHPSLLPKGRGPAPIINSILEGFKESGVTMYYVSEGLDDGDIIGQEKFVINENDHAGNVYEKVIEAGKKLIAKNIPLLLEGKAKRKPQNNRKATYFKKLILENNEINLDESLENIHRKIRALSKPYRGAYIKKYGKKLIIWRAEMEK